MAFCIYYKYSRLIIEVNFYLRKCENLYEICMQDINGYVTGSWKQVQITAGFKNVISVEFINIMCIIRNIVELTYSQAPYNALLCYCCQLHCVILYNNIIYHWLTI